jgi:RHS repeat-associated protein
VVVYRVVRSDGCVDRRDNMAGGSDQAECTALVATYSAIDAIGDRLSQGTGSSVSGYLIADLHGNIVAALSPGASPLYLSAYRYDPYGETVGSWSASSGLTVPWRFQGRILESDIGSGTDLYDFGARSYDPSLGAFTSFDSVAGSAQNPLTLNRYLYASANPATLVDPDGHRFMYDEDQSIGEKEQIAEERQALADDDSWDRSFSIFHTAPSDPLASLWTQVGNNEEHQFSHRKVLATTNALAAVDRKAVLRDSQTAAGAAAPKDTCNNIVCGITNTVGRAGGAAVNWVADHPIETVAMVGAGGLCVAFFAVCGPLLGDAAVNFAAGAGAYTLGVVGANLIDNLAFGGHKGWLDGWSPRDAALAGAGGVVLSPIAGLSPFVKYPIAAGVGMVTSKLSGKSGSAYGCTVGSIAGSAVGDWQENHQLASLVYGAMVGVATSLENC